MENSPRVLPRALKPSTLKGCVGTFKDGYYLRKVPLPSRAPQRQSPEIVTTAAVSHIPLATCYSQGTMSFHVEQLDQVALWWHWSSPVARPLVNVDHYLNRTIFYANIRHQQRRQFPALWSTTCSFLLIRTPLVPSNIAAVLQKMIFH